MLTVVVVLSDINVCRTLPILLVITTAVIGFKLMFRKYYRRPVPISPVLSYGQGFDENGNFITYIPVNDGKYEVITP